MSGGDSKCIFFTLNTYQGTFASDIFRPSGTFLKASGQYDKSQCFRTNQGNMFKVKSNSEANVTLQGNFSYFGSEYNNFEKTNTSDIALFGYNSYFILNLVNFTLIFKILFSTESLWKSSNLKSHRGMPRLPHLFRRA